MAEENKEAPAEEAKKEAPKEGAADAAAPAEGAKKPKKPLPIFAIGMGGGGAAVIGLAYFLTVAAVQTGASVLPQYPPVAGEEKPVEKTEEKKAEGEHGEHGEAKEGEGHEGGHEEGHSEGHGEEGHGEKKEAAGPVSETDPFLDIDEIQTNLKGSNQKRFVGLKISISIDAADKAEAGKKITTGRGKAAILDALNRLMRSKSLEDLEGGGANIELLKREIKEIINRIVFSKGEGRVTDVFVVKFIVQ